MKTKDEVTAKLQRFIIDVGRPGTLVSDGALEFKSKQFSDLCTSNGIKQEFSTPYPPEENGKIERAWGTVTGMTRCMMATAGVPKQFWPFALSTAIYLKNRSIHPVLGSLNMINMIIDAILDSQSLQVLQELHQETITFSKEIKTVSVKVYHPPRKAGTIK